MSSAAAELDGGDAERSRAQRLLDDWAAAIVANDPSRIAAFATDDWMLVTPESGTVPLDRFLAVVADGTLVHDEMSFEVLHVRRLGNCLVVVAHGTNRGTFASEPFSADELTTDVFVRDSGSWRCSVTALTPRTPSG